MRFGQGRLIVAILVFGWLPWNSVVRADHVADNVQQALDTYESSLGDDVDSSNRRSQLKLPALQEQLDQKLSPDLAALKSVRNALKGDPEAASIAAALDNWIDQVGKAIPADQLAAAAQKAKQKFQTVDEATFIRRRKELREARQQLSRLLDGWSEKNRKGWQRYLQLSDLDKQLEPDAKPDMRLVARLMAKMRINHKGLERPQFMKVRERLTRYRDAAYFSQAPRIKEQYEQNLDVLAKRLENYNKSPTSEDASIIGRTVGWLESGGQASDLVQSVRQSYTFPNLYAQASKDLLASGIAGPIDRTQPLNDNILGVSISGTTATTGQLAVELVPNSRQASMKIVMTGTAFSNTVGYRRPVTIYSTGTTSINADKVIVLDDQGFQLQPATASCSTSTSVNSICARSRLAQRIAWRRVGSSKGQSEYIASRRAEQQVASNMNDEAGESFEKPKTSFLEKFRKPLLRRGEFPRLLRFSTTEDTLQIKALQANIFQIAASNAPPKFTGKHDLGARVHTSLVGNFSEAILGGETMTDVQLAEFLKDLTGKIPEGLEPTDDKDPWSITFAQHQPITTEFADQKVKITIRGSRFTRGDEGARTTVRDAMYISATYKMERVGGGSKLTREGEAVAEYTNKKRQSPSEIAFKTFMKKNFEALFKPEFAQDGLKLPGRFEKAGKLEMRELSSANDWLVVGWNRPDENVKTALVQSDSE